ncbi:MAG TPA: type II toxin-antitoxin system RelE/ParE family toxin [Gemmataceae bacterium]|nr:type II toxin-antitoxin system RelE/ParE family toxin [Gemmataceae bacterium]
MAYRVELALRAEADAEAAYEWIAEDSPRRALKWLSGLLQKLDTLRDHPERCPLAPESEHFHEQVREMTYGKRRGVFRILFAIRVDIVHVFTIRHSARESLY